MAVSRPVRRSGKLIKQGGRLVIHSVTRWVDRNTGVLDITGYPPELIIPVWLEPEAGLTFTGMAPELAVTSVTMQLDLGAGELVVGEYSPVVENFDPYAPEPGMGELVYTGYAPGVSVEHGFFPFTFPFVLRGDALYVLEPGMGELVYTGYAPVLSVAFPYTFPFVLG